VADPGGRCLHLFDLHSRFYRKIGQLGGKPLLSPVGLCPGPDASVYVCDSEDLSIHRLSDVDGGLLGSLRLPEDILRPVAMSYHEASGELFVVDVKAHDIKVLDAKGGLRRILGRRGNALGEFNFPCDIADDGELLWIVDAGNARLQTMRRTGEPVGSFGQSGDAPGDLALPKAVAHDSDGQVYLVDSRFENVQIFDRTGQLLLYFGEEGIGPGQFWLPSDVFIDRNDRIWICDTYNGRVQVFQYVSLADDQREAQ
jgi:hypothetical protein